MVLTNTRHERFASALARGTPQGTPPKEAATIAGYPPGKAAETAWRLCLYPRIAERVKELQQPAILVRESLLQELGRQSRATAIADETGKTIGFYFPLDANAIAAAEVDERVACTKG